MCTRPSLPVGRRGSTYATNYEPARAACNYVRPHTRTRENSIIEHIYYAFHYSIYDMIVYSYH